MVEDDQYCPEILTQAAAVNSALNGFSRTLLSSHIHTCVYEDILNGKSEVIDELIQTIERFVK